MESESFTAAYCICTLPLNQVFARAIYNHLRHSSQVVERRHAQIFVVVPMAPRAQSNEVAAGLTRAFAQIGRAHHVTPDAERMPDPESTMGWRGKDRYDELEEQFDFLVYEADTSSTSWTKRSFRQADQVIFVADAQGSHRIGELEQLLGVEPGFTMKRKHLVLLHPADTSDPSEPARWREGREFERIYPIREKNSGDYARLARFLTGTAVGVVLGGGGARGFAHLGVLRALEQTGIVVDLIGGNSMGALIGVAANPAQ